MENLGTIQGEITLTTFQEGPIVVRRFVQNEQGVFIHKNEVIASSKGDYKFYVEAGEHYIAAFVDVNRDGDRQDGEPFNYHRYHGEPSPIMVNARGTVTVKLTITEKLPTLPADIKSVEGLILAIKNIGRVISLNDPMFVRKNYSTGLWKWDTFLKQVGGGLFLLQEYQQDKIPVLFVHGAIGGPPDFEEVIECLDKQHFQPWVLYYPSGINLDILSQYCVKAVTVLKPRV